MPGDIDSVNLSGRSSGRGRYRHVFSSVLFVLARLLVPRAWRGESSRSASSWTRGPEQGRVAYGGQATLGRRTSVCEFLEEGGKAGTLRVHWPLGFPKVLLFTLSITASVIHQGAGSTVKIGAVTCLTGALSTFGVSSIQGLHLAVDQMNTSGGVLGGPIDLIVEDNESKAGEPATITRKFISQDKVAAILGDLTSSATMEAAPLAQAAKIPMLTPSATNVAITKIGDYIFRSCFMDPFTGRIMAKFSLDTLHATRAMVMTDVKQDYSVGLTEAIRQYFVDNGRGTLSALSYSSGDTNFRTQLTAVRIARPDAVFLPGYYTEVALILRQARQLGITCPFVGGEGWDSPALIQVAGKSADGSFYTNHFSAADPDPRVQKFVQEYRARFGSVPDALAGLWYDGARLLAQAVQRAGSTDPAKIRDALATTRDFDGVTGRISIDQNRNAAKPGVILKIVDGTPEMVQRINP